MSEPTHDDVAQVIAAQLRREDLTAEDVLCLTIARRLNNASDNILARALGGGDGPPPDRRSFLDRILG